MGSFNTSLLDEAVIFAVNAHRGMERRGKGFPYIVHPLETVAIVATMTADQELLAAAALHDTVEDCAVPREEIRARFGERVAALVDIESVDQIEGLTEEESWHQRRETAINKLMNASHDAKLVALGDKLSNMRAIARDYEEIGDALWQRFHCTDPGEHRWHYRGLAEALRELGDTVAYKEFVFLMEQVFPPQETGENKTLPALDLRQWTRTGEGHTAESFDHGDGKTMMKLYFDFVPAALAEQELRVAEAAYRMGIPTPKPGELVTADGRMGCTFERIANKRSIGKAIADEPERLEEYALRFARLAKKLHTTPCDRALFPSYRENIQKILRELPYLSEKNKQKLLRFLDSVEDTGMCIHGDLTVGNVVTDGTTDYFIDMSEFSYGNPLFDVSANYIIWQKFSNERQLEDFHLSKAMYERFWNVFVEEYFGADTEEKLAEINRMIAPYAAIQSLVFLSHNGAVPDPPFLIYLYEALEDME